MVEWLKLFLWVNLSQDNEVNGQNIQENIPADNANLRSQNSLRSSARLAGETA